MAETPSPDQFDQNYFEGPKSNYRIQIGPVNVDYRRYDKDYYWKPVIKIVRKFIPQLPEGSSTYRILDLGCAYGFLTKRLTNLFNGKQAEIDVVGGDISHHALRQARKQKIPASFLQVNLNDAQKGGLPFADNSFHVITAYDVLEHAKGKGDDRWNLGEMNRILQQGGILALQVPVKDTWAGRILNRPPYDKDFSHINVPGKNEFLASLKQNGFELEHTASYLLGLFDLRYPGIPVAMEVVARKIRPPR